MITQIAKLDFFVYVIVIYGSIYHLLIVMDNGWEKLENYHRKYLIFTFRVSWKWYTIKWLSIMINIILIYRLDNEWNWYNNRNNDDLFIIFIFKFLFPSFTWCVGHQRLKALAERLRRRAPQECGQFAARGGEH